MNDFDADVCVGCGVPLMSYARVLAYSARLFNQGLAAARADRLTEARDLFAAVVYWSPLDVEARNALATACSALGDVAQARHHWEQVLCQRPNDSLAAAGLSGDRSWDTAQMSSLPATSAEVVIDKPAKTQFEVFLDEHRGALNRCLDGLTEEQARRSLVPSRTTLLGLVKHATFVEKVWFDEAVTCRSRAEIGIPATPDESFILDDEDTIATVQRAHRDACEAARRATSSLGLDDVVHGNRRGPLPLRWVYLHVLRELAQHCGHADILREQILGE